MKRKIAAVLSILVLRLPAIAQAHSGSFAVVSSSQNEIVMAADSRTHDSTDYADTHCKIAALGNKLIVGATGETGEGPLKGPPIWDANTISHDVFRRFQGKRASQYSISAFIDAWGRQAEKKVQDAFDRKVFRVVPSGIVLSVLFAGFRNGKVSITAGEITNKINGQRVVAKFVAGAAITTPGGQSFIGDSSVVQALAAGDPILLQEVKADNANLKPTDDSVIFSSVELVKLTIAHAAEERVGNHVIKGVGGPIDAVKISHPGGIQWISRKDNCPAN